MSQVQSGDLSKMGQLYERHKTSLFAYFYRHTSDQMKSEDLVQNTFIKMINSKDGFKGTGQFTYWMYHIARNTWIDNYRKKDPLHQAADLESTNMDKSWTDEENTDEKTAYKQQLEYALQHISDEKRDAIILSRYNGLTYKTIAEMSDCTENTIKSRVHRGIVEIREVIEKIKK